MRERLPAFRPWLALVALVSVGAWHWARIESPQVPWLEILALIAIAITPTLAAQLFGRIAGFVALVIAIPIAIGAATGMWPGSSGHHRYPAAVAVWINHGAHDWFNATTPFDYGRFKLVDGDARLLFMAIVAALAWTVVLRRWALISIGLGLVLFAFPSTVLILSHPWLRAAWFLAAALIALRLIPRKSLGGGGSSQAWALGTAVVLLGLVVSALPGVNKAAFMSWHTWDPLASTAAPRDLSYVWNQSYKPLHWKGKPTDVLDVWAQRPMYWKVGTLERFDNGAWSSHVFPITEGLSRDDQQSVSVPQPLLPPNARHPATNDLATVRVKVLALADSGLVSAAQPLKWTGPDGIPFALNTDTTADATNDLPRNATYSSIVYVANPTQHALEHAGRVFPTMVDRDLVLDNSEVTPWPQPAGTKPPAGIDPRLIAAANHVWTQSKASTEHNEWAAAVDVEAYFRKSPFKYDLTPKFSSGSPVLAQFMTTGFRGYCQMFSGSMAFVLRLHGIPSRVPVGFTTGVRTGDVSSPYVVTDRDAHSWVEVFIPGFGWQPFDPTPGRHLPDGASSSNPAFMAAIKNHASAGVDGRLIGTPAGLIPAARSNGAAPVGGRGTGRLSGIEHGGAGAATAALPAKSSSGHGFIAATVALVLVLVALMAAVKFVSVRWRYLRRGARAQASAAYRELSTFVGDQGIEDSPERTFEELSAEIKRVFGVDASAFAEHASRARYGPESRATPAGRELREDLRGIKRRIRAQLSLSDRFKGALRIRSALAQITSLD
jgi:transglutaminase-like putative cysteine protease